MKTTTIKADAKINRCITALSALNEQIKTLEIQRDAVKACFKDFAGLPSDKQFLIIIENKGVPVATLSTEDFTYLDTSALKEKAPTIWKKYAVDGFKQFIKIIK